MSEPEYIAISSLARAHVCPMQLYLEKLQPEKFTEPKKYSIAKQIALHLGEEIEEEKILNELSEIFPEKNFETEKIFWEMIFSVKKISWKKSIRLDVPVTSKRYKIFGRVDRVFEDGFSILKAGHAPTHGIYSADRLRMTACTICLEEAELPSSGVVEYLGSGTIRSFSMTPSDKRSFQHALRTTESILLGKIPQKISGSHCAGCGFASHCRELDRPKTLLEKIRGHSHSD